MWFSNPPWCIFARPFVVALAMLSATNSASGAQPQVRLPGSDLGLNTAIADSDVIETAEFQSIGMVMSSAAQYCGYVRISPSVVLKGTAKHEDSPDHGMVILFQEARPIEGQEYIFFLQGRVIIKMLPKSEENLKALSAMSKRVEALMSGDGGPLLGSGIALDEAVKRSDTVKTVVFESFSPQTVSGSTRSISKVDARPSVPFFKGMWVDMKSQELRTYGLSGPAQEAIPGIGEQYIVFIKDRTIFKVVWNTRANRDAVDKLVTQH